MRSLAGIFHILQIEHQIREFRLQADVEKTCEFGIFQVVESLNFLFKNLHYVWRSLIKDVLSNVSYSLHFVVEPWMTRYAMFCSFRNDYKKTIDRIFPYEYNHQSSIKNH